MTHLHFLIKLLEILSWPLEFEDFSLFINNSTSVVETGDIYKDL